MRKEAFTASRVGNLLILSLGRQIVAFDTLSSSDEPLWRMNTTSNLQYLNQRQAALRRNLRLRHSSRTGSGATWLGLIGPVTQDGCVFQVEQRLVCVDPLTGDVRWSRDNLPLGCDLFGDDQFVFAVPEGAEHALVFSTIDGRALGETTHRIPVAQERLTTEGRQMLRWRRKANRRWELSSLDALEGEVQWQREFDRNSKIDVSQNRFVAIAEPTGRCVIMDVAGGRTVVDQSIKANASLDGVHLLAGSQTLVVAARQPPSVNHGRHVRGFNGVDFTPAFAGQVYAFDCESGESLWEGPAEVQGLPLMLAQAVDLPFSAFGGNIRRQDKQGTKNETSIMLLEKSTGRMLYHEESLPQSHHKFDMRASDVESNTAVVEMLTRRIQLSFTGQPRAPEPPATHDAQRKADRGSRGLQKIGEKLFGEGF